MKWSKILFVVVLAVSIVPECLSASNIYGQNESQIECVPKTTIGVYPRLPFQKDVIVAKKDLIVAKIINCNNVQIWHKAERMEGEGWSTLS